MIENCGVGTNIQTNEDVAIKLVSIVDLISNHVYVHS